MRTAARPFLRSRHALGALLLLAAGGCGLNEYQAKMRSAQDRLERFEEENKLLGDPLAMPQIKDKEGNVISAGNIFLRPPKGISPTPGADPRGNLLFRYVPSKEGGAGPFQQLELAFGDKKDFRDDVLRNYPGADRIKEEGKKVQAPGRRSVQFWAYEFDDAQRSYSLYFWGDREDTTQGVVAYWMHKGQRDKARRAIDLSLESFAAGGEAATLRSGFKNRSPWQLKVTGKR